MVHPIPNLAVSPIYPSLWLLMGLWFTLVVIVMIRGYRRKRPTQDDLPDAIWILMRRAPLLLDDGAPRSTRSIFRRVVERIRHLIHR